MLKVIYDTEDKIEFDENTFAFSFLIFLIRYIDRISE
jgi:hypothetical protein